MKLFFTRVLVIGIAFIVAAHFAADLVYSARRADLERIDR